MNTKFNLIRSLTLAAVAVVIIVGITVNARDAPSR